MKEFFHRIKRNIVKKYNAVVFKYRNNRYAIAYRLRETPPLYHHDGQGNDFVLIPSSIRYWMADPFLYKHNGKNILFAELYDKHSGKGVIGCAELKGKKCKKFHVCLKEDFHMSYPCIFGRDGQIFMVPETKDDNKVIIYRALSFPKKWERYKVLCEAPCVDTTPFLENSCFLTTVNEGNEQDDNLFCISEDGKNIKRLLSNDRCLRSAGNLIFDDSEIIRPVQDDNVYGDAVVFKKITCLASDSYSEEAYRRVSPPGTKCKEDEISVSLLNNNKRVCFNGLHTYNINEDYEVIDLRYPRIKKGV